MADTKQKLPTPAWFKWLMLAFVGYAMASNLLHVGGPSDSAAPDRAASNREALKAVFDFDDFSNKLFPGFMPAFYKRDVETGGGPQAYCGQRVMLRLVEQVNADAPSAPQKSDGVLGARTINLAAEQAAEGMRVGGKRQVIAYAHQLFDAAALKTRKLKEKDKLTYEIELLSVSPPAPESAMGLKIIDEKIGGEGGLHCGDPARLRLAVWKADGTERWSNLREGDAPLEVELGKTSFGVQEGLQKMRIGGKRVLIIPPAFQKPLMPASAHANTASSALLAALDGKEAVIVEVTLLPDAPAKPSSP